MKILGTGLSGLIGSRLVELLDEYEFENLSRETGFDIIDKEKLIENINSSDASIIFHLAAKTDVDECEKDKSLGENGEAWKINVLGTENVVQACQLSKKKLIYVSTDFVFDGRNPPSDGYSEDENPNPINWYSKTKFEGEKIVQNSNLDWIIIRLAYPYRSNFVKKDFVRLLIEKFNKNEKLAMVTDHIMTPTFIDDIAGAFDILIKQNQKGIFHVVGSQSLTPYDAACLIAKIFDFDASLIEKTTREEFFKGRAPRPFNVSLGDDKIRRLGVRMKTFEEGLLEIKKQQKILI
ncbi:MAG: SDR family oxidoreductase [Candidatus Levyibacteriota bacterium]